MRLISRLPTGLLFLCFTLAAIGSADAAIVNFADQIGDDVVFTDITEVNGSADPSYSLFGGVSTMANTLDFDSFNFSGETSSGFNSESGRLSLTASSNLGSLISSLTISESGYASTFDESFVQVDLGGSVTIDGILSPSMSTSYTKSSSAGDGFASEFWERSFTFSFAPTDEVRIDLNNALFASASGFGNVEVNGLLLQVNTIPGTIDGTVGASAVPEPGSGFALACIAGILAVRRRFRRKV